MPKIEKTHYLKAELDQLIANDPAIFDFIQKSTLDGLWYWDLDAPEHEWMNPGFWELLGFEPGEKEHLAAEWQDLIHPDDLATALENFQKHCEDPGHAYDQMVRYTHKDGSTVWVRCRGLAVRDADGKPIRMLGAHTDVTELMEMQASLREAKDEAVAANESKTRFLANMSHELRTPLNAVIGFADLLERMTMTADREKLRGYAQTIGNSGRTMLSLVNDLLDFAKINAETFSIANQPFPLASELNNLKSAFKLKADENLVQLNFQLENSNKIVNGDAVRLRQVMFNLLDNAIKFTRAGNVTLRSRCEALDGKHLKLVIDVEDDGIGVPEDRLATIFNPFSQADTSITRQFGGTGLGLPISRGLAQAMGGDVTVVSENGRGSIFTATFYFEDLTDIYQKMMSMHQSPQPSEDVNLGLHVLAVDDVPSNLEVVSDMLAELGCTAHCVNTAEEALNWLQSNGTDMVLMDLHMPGTDGITAAGQIQSLPGTTNQTPIYAWTADVMSDQLISNSPVNWAGTIIKPTTRDALLMAVRQISR